MPTTEPRYTFTDTGRLRELLDSAQSRWPEITDRKALLLRLAEEGNGATRSGERHLEAAERCARAQAALDRVLSLIDSELLRSDQAWS